MFIQKKFSLSTIAIGVVAFACLLIDFSFKNWEKRDRVIEWDVHSYYAYLPALFIYDDIKLEKSDYRHDENHYLFWPVFTDDGRKVIKVTMGTAYFYAPFFFIAHAYASVTDYPEDGFSEPYKVFLLLSTVFYLIIGLGFLKKILSHYNFSDNVISIVILLIGLGTNILCYASQSAPMGHVYSFCLFSIFIYFTIKWYQHPSFKTTIILGLLFGWITLIRPTNFIIILFFVLYGISTLSELKQRILLFKENWLKIILFCFFSFLFLVPQLLYWKAATGNYLSYSYGDEGFFFSHPRIFEGLFGWRKGWLVYTPMMAFALLGLFFLRNGLKKLRLPIIIFMVVNIYIILSWWCWWYGGSFGQRSFIENYAMLAIPFASFVKFLSEKKWYLNVFFYFIAAFFIWLNIFQTCQFEFHSLHHDGMTKELYFKQVGKMEKVKDFDSMVHWPNYEAALKGDDCETPPAPARPQTNKPVNKNEFFEKETGRKTILLKAANGKYICADGGLNHIMVANRDSAQGWEMFTLLLFEKKQCAILAYNDRFFSVGDNKRNEVSARGERIGKSETFTLMELESNRVSLKCANGKFIGVDEKTLQVFANADSIDDMEKFEIIMK